MPWVRRLPSGRWAAQIRDATGRKRSPGFSFPTKTAARQWGLDQETQLRQGVWRDPKVGRVTVADWYLRWSTTGRVVEDSTRAKDTSRWRNHVEPAWGRWTLDGITRMEAQAWVGRMSRDGIGAETIAQSVRLLGALLQAALEDDLITRNPARGLTLPTAPRQPDRALTPAEQQQLLDAFGEPARTVVLTFLTTGLRWAELAGLQVHRLDLLRRRLHVVEVLRRDGRLKPYPKGRRLRTLPLPPQTVDALAAHLRPHQVGSVFTGAQGGALNYSHWRSRVWTPGLDRAGLPDPQPTVHDLRHSYASQLANAGVPAHVIAARLGHASTRTTDRYTHEAPDADALVLAALRSADDRLRVMP